MLSQASTNGLILIGKDKLFNKCNHWLLQMVWSWLIKGR